MSGRPLLCYDSVYDLFSSTSDRPLLQERHGYARMIQLRSTFQKTAGVARLLSGQGPVVLLKVASWAASGDGQRSGQDRI